VKECTKSCSSWSKNGLKFSNKQYGYCLTLKKWIFPWYGARPQRKQIWFQNIEPIDINRFLDVFRLPFNHRPTIQ
jgi:hypothetical protein